MDPKSPLYDKNLDIVEVVAVIQKWVDTGKPFYWSIEPDDLITKLLFETSMDGWINYPRAIDILRCAETTKMHGQANRGLAFIKDEWKKLAKQ